MRRYTEEELSDIAMQWWDESTHEINTIPDVTDDTIWFTAYGMEFKYQVFYRQGISTIGITQLYDGFLDVEALSRTRKLLLDIQDELDHLVFSKL